jgi:hypothetical protein
MGGGVVKMESVIGPGDVLGQPPARAGLMCRVRGAGCWIQCSGCWVQGSVFRVQGTGFRVQGSG